MVITTPSGYKVTIKDFLTFGERRELEKELLKSTGVNPTTKEVGDVSASTMYDMQDKAFQLLVSEIIVEGNVVAPDKMFETVQGWRDEDGDAVYKEITRISAPKQQGEKK